ncbi:MAG: hypothetical protein RL322_2343, partial [Pseudomonadota bacterium]
MDGSDAVGGMDIAHTDRLEGLIFFPEYSHP